MADAYVDAGPNDIIDAAKACVQDSQTAMAENRREAEKDLALKAGEEHFPAQIAKDRQASGRPCLIINELPMFTAQICNDYKQNPPGVLVHPVDDTSDPKKAEILEGLGRNIVYASSGQTADEVAFESAVDIGWGYWRLYTDYVSEDSFDQEILFGALPDTLSVYFDPHSTAIDGSDATMCVLKDKMTRTEFERQYPGAAAANTSWLSDKSIGEDWLTQDSVYVAEYYCCEYTPDTLYLLRNGGTGWASDPRVQHMLQDPMLGQQTLAFSPDGQPIFREVQRKQVKWYKLTAVDVLEERTLPGRWIPVIPVYGNCILVKGKRKRFGVLRFLRDPQMMLDFWETTTTEVYALQPRAPWVGPAGFMGPEGSAMRDAWRTSNNSNVVALEYAPTDDSNMPITTPPQRIPFPTINAAFIEQANRAREYMREISGIRQPARLTAGSSRSGESLRQEDQQADMASFHFFRNAAASMLHAWRIMLAWIPHYYDAPRVVRILGEDGLSKPVAINQVQQQMTAEGQALEAVLNDMTVGHYDVIMRSGPSYQTKRQEAVEGMMDMGRVAPKIWDVAGSEMVKNLDWPGADRIAKKLAATEPPVPGEEADAEELLPQVQAQLEQKTQEAQALNALAQQMEDEAQKLTQENEALKAQIASKQMELQVKHAELVIRQEELRLREQEIMLEGEQARMKHQVEMAQLQVQREQTKVSLVAVHENGREEEVSDG